MSIMAVVPVIRLAVIGVRSGAAIIGRSVITGTVVAITGSVIGAVSTGGTSRDRACGQAETA